MPVGNIVVSASGSYQTYLKQGLGNLYQIQTLLWSYSKNASCTVNSVTVSYGTAGTAYSIPSLDLTHYSYSHVITSDIASPSEGYTYFKDSTPCPFAVDIAVSSSSGSMGGMYFSCYAYIDGVRHMALMKRSYYCWPCFFVSRPARRSRFPDYAELSFGGYLELLGEPREDVEKRFP